MPQTARSGAHNANQPHIVAKLHFGMHFFSKPRFAAHRYAHPSASTAITASKNTLSTFIPSRVDLAPPLKRQNRLPHPLCKVRRPGQCKDVGKGTLRLHPRPYRGGLENRRRRIHLLTIPPNTTATVFLPEGAAQEIQEGDKPIAQVADISPAKNHSLRTRAFEVGSGTYAFLVR